MCKARGGERLEWLRRLELDAVLGVVDTGVPGIEFHPLRTSTMVLAMPPDHPLAGHDPVEPEVLNRVEFIAPTPAEQVRRLGGPARGRRLPRRRPPADSGTPPP